MYGDTTAKNTLIASPSKEDSKRPRTENRLAVSLKKCREAFLKPKTLEICRMSFAQAAGSPRR